MEPEGIILLVALAAALIFGSIYAVKQSAKIRKELKEQYPVKASYGHAYVTGKGELIFYWDGVAMEYRKWNLSDIASIATMRGEMGFYDKDGKILPGEYLVEHSKIHASTIEVGLYRIDGYVAFIKKHGPHIQHTVGGKVVQD